MIPALLSLVPFIGGLIAGDRGKEVGGTVANIATMLTGTEDPTLAAERLQKDTVLLMQFKTEIMRLAERETALQVADLANARSMQNHAVLHADKTRWIAPIISLFIILGVFGYVGTVLYFVFVYGTLTTEMRELVFFFGGALISALTSVLSFWLGSSRGSEQKTDIINRGMK